jgi:DNA-binding helix-turn-helix protein
VAKLQAKGLSVSREMLSQMENGKYNIRVSILLALKDIYKCSTEDFFNDLQG